MEHLKERELQVTLVSLEHAHGQGNNNKRDGRPGPEEFGLRNPTACIRACRDQFIRARSGETGDNYRDICRILSRSGPNEDLWELYTCDSTFCGVANCAVDQDPNVDLIINVCRGYNYYSIFDPGPPPSPKPEICANEVKVNPDPEQSDQRGRPSETAEVSVEGIKTLTLQNDPSSTVFSSTSSSSATPTPPTPEGNSTSTAPDIVKVEATQPSTGLAAGSKAAIGICASIALIVIILLTLFVMRRRRKDPKGYLRAVRRSPHHHSHSFSQAPIGAHTPLITTPPSAAAASRTAPSTPPPARLSDRKFLSLIPTLGGGGGDPTAPSSPSSVYPSSEYLGAPLASPTHASPSPSYYNRLFPLHSNNSHHQNPHHHKHRRHTPVGTADLNSPLQPPLPVVTSLLGRDSASSLGSCPAARGARSALMLSGGAGFSKANSVDSGAATVTGTGTPPLSPTRAGHEMSPDVAVAAPAGPPPNRALPPTPPPHHHHQQQQQQQQYYCPLPSPTSTLSVPVSPRSPPFPHPHSPPQPHPQRPFALGSGGASPVAAGSSEKLHHYHETIGVALPGSPTTVTAAAGSREDLSARDLCELTESYARETRESWGSWNGTGGGGPGGGGGVGARKRGSGNNSPMRCSGDRKASGGGGAGGNEGTAVALRDLDLEKLGGSY
ncbi:hypothetical protein DL762_001216 [Monosporascus cannonballus]|uniref:Uncharacterized protein n=1 Tax=Monosporascus cannonballus TaxID=155416 RepID=A0ABY0HIH3_9PEZI|nr:hypothetical protein DL762_001216 [Monosporascus cannonballus]